MLRPGVLITDRVGKNPGKAFTLCLGDLSIFVMTLFLRCKSNFILDIIAGRKTVEYRSETVFYQNRLQKPFTEIHLSNQWGLECKAQIVRIVLEPTPEFLIGSPFVQTKNCFAIYLKGARKV